MGIHLILFTAYTWRNNTITQFDYGKARSTKRKPDYDRFHRLKGTTQKECRNTYIDYSKNIINPELSANPKILCGFIKSNSCESVGVSPLKDTDGLTYSESEEKANILSCQISSVFTSNEDIKTIPDKGQSTHTHAWTIFILLKMVSWNYWVA